MGDTRIRVVTDKPVNLGQLADELGEALNGDENTSTGEPGVVVVCDPETALTTADVEAAIKSHVPVWPLTASEKIAEAAVAPEVKALLTELLGSS